MEEIEAQTTNNFSIPGEIELEISQSAPPVCNLHTYTCIMVMRSDRRPSPSLNDGEGRREKENREGGRENLVERVRDRERREGLDGGQSSDSRPDPSKSVWLCFMSLLIERIFAKISASSFLALRVRLIGLNEM